MGLTRPVLPSHSCAPDRMQRFKTCPKILIPAALCLHLTSTVFGAIYCQHPIPQKRCASTTLLNGDQCRYNFLREDDLKPLRAGISCVEQVPGEAECVGCPAGYTSQVHRHYFVRCERDDSFVEDRLLNGWDTAGVYEMRPYLEMADKASKCFEGLLYDERDETCKALGEVFPYQTATNKIFDCD